MSEQNQSSNQTNQSQDFKRAARDEALSAAEKGLEAAREALEQAEKRLADLQQSCNVTEQQQNTTSAGGASYSEGSSSATSDTKPAEAVSANNDANPCEGASDNSTGNTQHQGYWQGQTAQGTYQYQPTQPSYTAASISPKDHVAAGLLAIFLGTFGIHKFYLGYNTQGFIMLAISILAGVPTFGIAPGVIWVIAVIEGILYLTKSQSDFERTYVYGKREWF